MKKFAQTYPLIPSHRTEQGEADEKKAQLLILWGGTASEHKLVAS